MERALVTGGCGFIGSHLVDRLIAEDYEVVVIDNCSTGRLRNLDHLSSEARVKVILKDLNDQELDLKQIVSNVEVVYHLAALADIVPSIENPVGYFEANVTATMRLMEACRNQTNLRKIVYSASSSCYGIPSVYPTPETAEIKPEYPYALTKRMGEEIVLHWGKLYKLPVISCRFFNVYGPRSRTSGTYGAVFGVFLAQKLAGQPYTIVGDGSQTRDFTYVTDVVDAVFRLSQSSIENEIFNVGSDNHYSVNRLVELLGGSKVFIPKRPGEPDCTFADIRKLKSAIHWAPQVSLEVGVQNMLSYIEYWREAPVWTPESIEVQTKAWFSALEDRQV